ncbi:MAG: DNA translocase FtsK [Bacilli bacterium]
MIGQTVNKKPQITMGNRVQIPLGIMLTLLGLIGLLNRWLGAYMTYIIAYLFGILYFIVYLLLMFWGVNFVFAAEPKPRDRNAKRRLNLTLIGFLLFMLGLLMLASHFYLQGVNIEFPLKTQELHPYRISVMGTLGESLKTPLKLFGSEDAFLGGGIIGDFFYTLATQVVGNIGTYLVIGLFFLLGTLFTFSRLFSGLFKNLVGKHADWKTRRRFFQSASSLEHEGDNYTPPEPINRPVTPAERLYRQGPMASLSMPSSGLRKAVYFDREPTPKVETPVLEPVEAEEAVTPVASVPTFDPYAPPTTTFTETPIIQETPAAFTLPRPQPTPPVTPPPPPMPTPSSHLTKPQPSMGATAQVPSQPERVDVTAKPILTHPEVKAEKKVTSPSRQAKRYVYPDLSLLEDYATAGTDKKNEQLALERTDLINQTFEDFGVGARVVSYTIGPAVTQYDILTNRDVSVSSVSKIIDDISVRLGGIQARFSTLVEGKTTSGLEIPNYKTSTVGFKDCIGQLPSPDSYKKKMLVPFGKSIAGQVVFAPLNEFPHLLVAGSTGSGKSIFMHSLLMTLIMRNTVEELKLMIIDPKRVEMSRYRDLPHLLCPIITKYEEAQVALNRLADEMEARYDRFEQSGTSNIKQYNELMEEEHQPIMPTIVVIIDEYADLVEGAKDIATPVVRIAQKSRAAGIHLIISTQRPSVNVITGTIKANLPTRVALMVASAVDSGTILGMGGAETLLGNGDMLVSCVLVSRQGVTRVQGAYVDNKEIRRVVKFLADNYESDYHPNFIDLEEKPLGASPSGNEALSDERYPEVKAWVMTQDFTSINKIMQAFNFGFTRASRIFTMLQNEEVIEASDAYNTSSRGCKVLQKEAMSAAEQAMFDNQY